MMRNILLLFCALGISTLSFAQLSVTPESFEWTITGETTREQLSEVSKALYAQHYKFVYQPEFDGNRHILGIKYTLFQLDTGIEIGSGQNMQLTLPQAKLKIRIDRVNNTSTHESTPN